MNMPEWTKPALWGAVCGAAAMAVIGFNQLGWTTAGTTKRMAQEQSDAAVVVALTPACLAKARGDADGARMVKFRAETSSYSRREMVSDAGWATPLGGQQPNRELADACSDQLYTAKPL